MNFLSHFYFDKENADCYHMLGTVLPDLLKNADKKVILHPEKLQHKKKEINSIITGWNKHLEVDRYFHSSNYFITNAHHLKKILLPALNGSPVKPFFLGHIALELVLDNLLVTTNKINVESFYNLLEACDLEIIEAFLNFAGLNNTDRFFKFYNDFVQSKYLFTYSETKQVAYALKRICMRVWQNPFTPENEELIDQLIFEYRKTRIEDFVDVFEEIEVKLRTTNSGSSLNINVTR